MFRAIGWQELLIVVVILVINFAVPAAFIILAVVFARRGATSGLPTPGSLDVRRWRTSTVRWLLAGTVFPFGAGAAWIAYFAAAIARDPFSDATLGFGFVIVFGTAVLSSLVAFAMLIVYVTLAVRSPVADTAKVMWCLALVIGGPIAYPFAFYYLVALPRRSAELPAPPHGELNGVGG